MLKTAYIVFLLQLISIEVAGQMIGIIQNTNGERIPYAVIKVLHKPKGTITDEQGVFSIENITNFDTLFISALGYVDIKLSPAASETNPWLITLNEEINELPEFVFINPKKYELQDANKILDFRFHPIEGMQIVSEIDLKKSKTTSRVKSIKLKVKHKNFDKNAVQLIIFSKNKNGGPKKYLLNKSPISPPTIKGKWLTFDNINLITMDSSLYIGLFWIRKPDGKNNSLAFSKAPLDSLTFVRQIQLENWNWIDITKENFINRSFSIVYNVALE